MVENFDAFVIDCGVIWFYFLLVRSESCAEDGIVLEELGGFFPDGNADLSRTVLGEDFCLYWLELRNGEKGCEYNKTCEDCWYSSFFVNE